MFNVQVEEWTYGKLIRKIAENEICPLPPHKERIKEEFAIEYDIILWQSGANIKRLAIDTKMRSFIFQLQNGILYANKDYHRFGYRDDSKCTWCEEPRQNLRHMMTGCVAAQTFWGRLGAHNQTVYNDQCILSDISGSQTDGIFTTLGCRYLHRCNHLKDTPKIQSFIASVRQTEKTEREIAEKRNCLAKHNLKWCIANLKINQ